MDEPVQERIDFERSKALDALAEQAKELKMGYEWVLYFTHAWYSDGRRP